MSLLGSNPYKLTARLAAGETIYTAWSSVPDTGMVGQLASQPFGAITLDMQHGGHTDASVWDGVAAIIAAGSVAVVRIPVGRNDMASRALDFGADAVIAPMINSVDDAIAFGAAAKYPPLGARSWGPSRATAQRGIAGGNDYLHSANRETVSIAMIETRAALAASDAILSVPTIDGVFVGPADFSIDWTGGGEMNPMLPDMMEAIANVAQAAINAGKLAAIFAANPADAPKFAAMGFRFIAVGFDTAVIARGSAAVLEDAKGR